MSVATLSSMRLRRTMLYVPANHQRAVARARELPTDAVILDLEDGVAPSAKSDARTMAADILREHNFGWRERLVRINNPDGVEGEADLAAILAVKPDGIVLPKCDDPSQVAQVAAQILEHSPKTKLWLMIETALGVLNAMQLAAATPILAGFIMGTSDLAKQLGCRQDGQRNALLYAMSHSLLVARAYGLAAIDGAFLDINDGDGLLVAAQTAMAMGFDGKTVIHPNQLAIVNAAFSPNEDELNWASRVVEEHSLALEKGFSVMLLDGRMIEQLDVDRARQKLRLAQLITRQSES